MTDRIAVITGAGSGIGRAAVLAFCADGWSVAMLGRRADALDETASLAVGGSTYAIPNDVGDPNAVVAEHDGALTVAYLLCFSPVEIMH
jgi:NADP-dependent 3-hydroxy acid dehydrogenase YdfG